MKTSRVLTKLRSGQTSLGVTLHLTDPSVFELAGLMGFDAIWMDMEHHGYSLETAANLIRGARVGGTDVITRPGKGEFMRMSRMLELGAKGIMYPRCDSAAEAREVVRWAKFAPLGQRGFDGAGADAPFLLTPMARYLREANEQTFIIIQIEDQSALDQAEEIAAVPGVDMLMLGPADFSILSGIPGEFTHPKILAAYEKVAQAVKKSGKSFAAIAGTVEIARKMIDMGAGLLFHSADIILIKSGFERIQAEFGPKVGLTFNRAPELEGASYLGGD